MNAITDAPPAVVPLTPAARCPDFDLDCASVTDPVRCAAGSTFLVRGLVVDLPPSRATAPASAEWGLDSEAGDHV